LPQFPLTALQFQREQQREHRRLFADDYMALDLIFCEPDGNYHQPDLVSQVVIRRLRKAGIKSGSFHTSDWGSLPSGRCGTGRIPTRTSNPC
jgi:hypothetical protein